MDFFARYTKIIQDLPNDSKYKQKYIQRFKDMAVALASTQQNEGYWTRSILDPEHATGPETIGTYFFTYGFLWGINNGVLDKETYLPVVQKSMNYLTTVALQENGAVGYIEPIGEKAIPGQVVDVNSTTDFGVGVFLLAASDIGGPKTSTTRTTPFSRGNSNFYLYGSGKYFDNDSNKFKYQQALPSNNVFSKEYKVS